MAAVSKINIEELRAVINSLLDHLCKGGVSEVDLINDYYWQIDSQELCNVVKNPTDLTIGSLFDDLESMRGVASGESEPIVLLLLKIAPLLRYLGDTVTETQLSPKATE